MKCDGCGREMDVKDKIVDAVLVEFPPALLLQIPDCEEAQSTLGKYYGTKVNVNGILTWAFCYECVLGKFLEGKEC